MLSGMDGLNNSSTENASRDKPSAGKSLEATLANRSSSELFNIGIECILKEENVFINFHTSILVAFKMRRQTVDRISYLSNHDFRIAKDNQVLNVHI
jgi:hypothetical protein